MRSNELESYKCTLALTEEQHEILVGILLGDAHLETQNHGRTFRLKLEQSEFHEPYINYLHEIFSAWVRTSPRAKRKVRNGVETKNMWFQTLSHGAFRFYAQQFYTDGRKRVPELVHRWLSPRGLAFWYMDDGSVKSRQSKGVIFNTQGFSRGDVERLCHVLEQQFVLRANVRKQGDGFQIYVSGESFEQFSSLVSPYIIPEMRYKIPAARQTQLPKE